MSAGPGLQIKGRASAATRTDHHASTGPNGKDALGSADMSRREDRHATSRAEVRPEDYRSDSISRGRSDSVPDGLQPRRSSERFEGAQQAAFALQAATRRDGATSSRRDEDSASDSHSASRRRQHLDRDTSPRDSHGDRHSLRRSSSREARQRPDCDVRDRDRTESSRWPERSRSRDRRDRQDRRRDYDRERDGRHSDRRGSPRRRDRMSNGSRRDSRRSESPRRDLGSRRPERRRGRSRSSSDSETSSSDSETDSEEEERRRRKRRERRRREEKEDRERRRRKDRHRSKSSKDDKPKPTAASTATWGKYGIISEGSLSFKESEFKVWLIEERRLNPDHLSRDKTKKEFAVFVEDFNTATLPHEKYYDLAKHEARMQMIRSGATLTADEGPTYNFLADMTAHKKRLDAGYEKPAKALSREEIMELRRVEAERTEIGHRRLLGLPIPREMGVRTEEVDRDTLFDRPAPTF